MLKILTRDPLTHWDPLTPGAPLHSGTPSPTSVLKVKLSITFAARTNVVFYILH